MIFLATHFLDVSRCHDLGGNVAVMNSVQSTLQPNVTIDADATQSWRARNDIAIINPFVEALLSQECISHFTDTSSQPSRDSSENCWNQFITGRIASNISSVAQFRKSFDAFRSLLALHQRPRHCQAARFLIFRHPQGQSMGFGLEFKRLALVLILC